MAKDFYQVLGLGRDAEPRRIRQAYRHEVKKCHPDASGSQCSARRFREVEEAYETLRDADRREAYDRDLRRREAGSGSTGRPRPAAFAAEPLRSDASGAGPWGFGDPAADLPLPWFGFFGRRPRGEPVLEVLLSADEARRGLSVPVQVPVRVLCPQCADSGPLARLLCALCGGRGTVLSHCAVCLRVAPDVRDGTELRCELDPDTGWGFLVRVRVQSA